MADLELRYNEAFDTLVYYDTHYVMLKKVMEESEKDERYLGYIPADAPDPLTVDLAAYILRRLGFTEEAKKMMEPPIEHMPGLFDVPPMEKPAMLDTGFDHMPPLLSYKDIPPPSSAEIEAAIKDIKDLTVFMMQQYDTISPLLTGFSGSKPCCATQRRSPTFRKS